MESELEKLQLEITGALYTLTVEQLIKVCNELEISGPDNEHLTGKSRSQLISYVTKHNEREEMADLEDEGMSELLNVQDIIDKAHIATNVHDSEILNQSVKRENLQKEVEALRLSIQEKENAMHDLMNTSMNHPAGFSTPAQNLAQALPSSSMWRKDLKIAGQIGEPGQKDRLTFSSLTRQIENGFSKGYQESEIIDAVIRAITPGLQLRSYLEGKEKLRCLPFAEFSGLITRRKVPQSYTNNSPLRFRVVKKHLKTS